jgi:hypothetical protein
LPVLNVPSSHLFSEDSYFASPDLFWAEQQSEVDARKAAYPGASWQEMVIVPTSQYFHAKCKTQKISIALSFRGNNDRSIGYSLASLHGLRDPTGPASSGAGFFDPLV